MPCVGFPIPLFMKLVFASNNNNKLEEIKQLLPADLEIISLEAIGCFEEIEETATTIEGNAILKANYITENYGFDCFSDDSGLEIDALQGAPGVHSARFAGEQRNSEDNMNKVLSALANESNRKAQFKTVIALNFKGKQYLFTGIAEGEITTQKMGTQGFGYDPIFLSKGSERTFAELSKEEKGQFSHRGKAIQQLVEFLKNR